VTGRSYAHSAMNQPENLVSVDIPCSAEFLAPQWYVLFVRSNQEKRIAHSLHQRGVEHFLPCYSSLRHWKDRRVRLEMPLFPGYIFIRLPFVERLRALTVPNVVSLVGRKDLPAVISTEEITWIQRGLAHGQAEPHEYLAVGQHVMITDGPLSGMQGILIRKTNGARVVVSLDSIARAFMVEVEESSVKVLGSENIFSARLPGASDAHEQLWKQAG
jgi:transcription antitermination factor NusG